MGAPNIKVSLKWKHRKVGRFSCIFWWILYAILQLHHNIMPSLSRTQGLMREYYHAPCNWAKGNPNLFFILFPSLIQITSALFSFTSICLYSSILLSAFICTFLFLVTIHLFSFHLSYFTFTIFSSRFFQTLISYLHSDLHIWFYSTLPLVLCMLNYTIYRYYYI